MEKISLYAQLSANIATILIAVLLGLFLIRDTLAPPRIPATIAPPTSFQGPAPNISPVGQKVPLNGIDWAKNEKTLVMYLSSKCRYCTDSGPFYKRLVEAYKSSKGIKFVAVMPQPNNEAKEYLSSLGVGINEIYQAPLQPIGVKSTPTLLLVDESGTVTDLWVGKLQPEREQQVVSKLSL